MEALVRPDNNPVIIFHRGRHGLVDSGEVIKENSLAAFNRAVGEGAAMIEFDVWGGLRVAHDPDGEAEASPTVSEALDTINGKSSVNIEIKSPAVLPELFRLLDQALASGVWKAEQIVLSSFDHQSAIACKRRLPALKVGAVMDCVPAPKYLEDLAAAGVNTLNVNWYNLYIDRDGNYSMRDAARRLGMEIWSWTINKPEVFCFAREYGVMAVFTDMPSILASL